MMFRSVMASLIMRSKSWEIISDAVAVLSVCVFREDVAGLRLAFV